MENRPGKDKAKIQRPLFTATGQVTRLQAYALIDQAEEGSTYFRVVISPDPVKENPAHDLPMREITKAVMDIEEIVGKPVTWVAAVQDDHTDIPHVHILAVARVRYLPAKPMIAKATKSCRELRRELDLAKERAKEQGKEKAWERERSK